MPEINHLADSLFEAFPQKEKELFTYIGFAVYSWARLENSIDLLVFYFQRKNGSEIHLPLNFQSKIDYISLSIVRMNETELVNDYQEISSEILTLTRTRNFLAHGFFVNRSVLGPLKIAKIAKKPFGVDYVTFESIEEIKKFGEDVFSANLRLMVFASNFIDELEDLISGAIARSISRQANVEP